MIRATGQDCVLDELTHSVFHDLSQYWRTSILYKRLSKNQLGLKLSVYSLDGRLQSWLVLGHPLLQVLEAWVSIIYIPEFHWNWNVYQPLVPANTPWATILSATHQKKSNYLLLLQPNKPYVSQAFCQPSSDPQASWKTGVVSNPTSSSVLQSRAATRDYFHYRAICRFFSPLMVLSMKWNVGKSLFCKAKVDVSRCLTLSQPKVYNLKIFWLLYRRLKKQKI